MTVNVRRAMVKHRIETNRLDIKPNILLMLIAEASIIYDSSNCEICKVYIFTMTCSIFHEINLKIWAEPALT